MSSIEKEIRLKINDNDIERIKKITDSYKERTRLIDITCGKYGFDSLSKLGYIGRIRCNGNSYKIEIKNYQNKDECLEKSLSINSIRDGLDFFKLLNMEPYLVLDRYREVRKYNNLLIFIDEFATIGSYVEIEYQESEKEEAYKFIELLGLNNEEQDKYGDIVKNLISNDDNFKNSMIKMLEEYSE